VGGRKEKAKDKTQCKLVGCAKKPRAQYTLVKLRRQIARRKSIESQIDIGRTIGEDKELA